MSRSMISDHHQSLASVGLHCRQPRASGDWPGRWHLGGGSGQVALWPVKGGGVGFSVVLDVSENTQTFTEMSAQLSLKSLN